MKKACIDINQLILVFSHNKGSIYQSDKLSCFYLDFGGKFARFNCISLRKIKKVLEDIDIDKLLLNTEQANFEVITFNGCDHIYLLDVLEIISLKELLQGAFTMFKLNHMISDCLYRLAV